MPKEKAGSKAAAGRAAGAHSPDYEKVRGALAGFKEQCLLEGVPMLGFFAVEDSEQEKTTYESEAVTPLSLGVELSNDRVTVLSAALCGDS